MNTNNIWKILYIHYLITITPSSALPSKECTHTGSSPTTNSNLVTVHAIDNFLGLLFNWVLSKLAFQFAYPFDVVLISATLPMLSMWRSKRKLDEKNWNHAILAQQNTSFGLVVFHRMMRLVHNTIEPNTCYSLITYKFDLLRLVTIIIVPWHLGHMFVE
jgi:hypothetical protein